MKKLIFILLINSFPFKTWSQLSSSLIFNTRPPAAINTWDGRNDLLTLIIVNSSPIGTAKQVKINAKITDANGATVAQTNKILAPVKLIPPGTTSFRASDVFDRNFFEYTGSYNNKINKSGRLPSGNYTLSIQLDSSAGSAVLTNPITRSFLLVPIQLPILLLPADESSLPAAVAKSVITFRWTPLVPRPKEPTKYRIQVFEVLAHQTPLQALRGNQPLLDKTVTDLTQYIWNPQLPFIDSLPVRFVWTIQCFDFQGHIISGEVPNGEGRSEAKSFLVNPTPANDRLGKRNNGL